MPMYNSIAICIQKLDPEVWGGLWQYYRDEADNAAKKDFESFKSNVKITAKLTDNGRTLLGEPLIRQ